MDNDKDFSRNLRLALTILGLVTGPIVGGVILGWAVERFIDPSRPWLVVGLIAGFLASVARAIMAAKE